MSDVRIASLPRARNPRPLIIAGVLVSVLLAWLIVAVGPAHAAATLLSQGKTATSSSVENAGTPAADAVDGNTGTRWSSAFADPQWIEVDLGSTASISQVVLQWETAYASAFQIQTSPDGSTWTSIYSTTTGTGGTQTLNITGSGRYVRMYGTTRATQWGYSLWEFQIYGTIGGTGGACGTTNAAVGHTATASSTENAGTPAVDAFDGNTGTRWSSAFSDPQWVEVDLGASLPVCQVVITWEAAYATAFQIQTSPDGSTWTSIYSTTTGTGGTQTLNVTGTGRYLRMYGTARSTVYGYSIWELAVYTTGGVTASPSPTPTQSAPGTCPWVNSTAPIATRVSQLLAQMTLAQKISMLHGTGASSPYIGDLGAIPALCIPAMGLQDGPAGVGDGMGGVTQMPAPITEAATFDTALEKQYGATIGAEFAAKGANVDLGPTTNIIRDPRWGRAFETFSEDPYLSGQMTVADVQGIQSQGVMAQVKHAAVYNQETNRNAPADNAIVDARTLNEIYLPAFQSAVTTGAAASVMCAYSTINGDLRVPEPIGAQCSALPAVRLGRIRDIGLGCRALDRRLGQRRHDDGDAQRLLLRRLSLPGGHRGHGHHGTDQHDGDSGADADVRVRPIRPRADRLADGHGHHAGPRGGRVAGCRGGHRTAEEHRHPAAVHIWPDLDRGHRSRRRCRYADDRRWQRDGHLARHDVAAHRHPEPRGGHRHHGHLQRRLQPGLGGDAGTAVERRDRVRQRQLRQRGQ